MYGKRLKLLTFGHNNISDIVILKISEDFQSFPAESL